MNGQFIEHFNGLVENAILVEGQTSKTLCLKLFSDQIINFPKLSPEAQERSMKRIGEIGLFLSDTPNLYNELKEKLNDAIKIKPGQLKDLVKRARAARNKTAFRTSAAKEAPATEKNEGRTLGTRLKAELFHISQLRDEVQEKNRKIAEKVIEYLMRAGRLYRHRELRNFDSCLYFDNVQKRLLPLTGDEFQSWLADFTGINMSTSIYSFVFDAVKVVALSGLSTPEIVPEKFWCSRGDTIYMSCGDGRIVKIGPGKVTVEDNGVDDVLFASGYTLAPWTPTSPEDPFSSCSLFKDMKLVNGHSLDLLRVWCVSLPANQPSKPPIVLTGPVGGGKTKTAGGIFELFGIYPRITKPEENGEIDFWTSMDAGGLLCLDNADSKFKWLPDALAAAATSGKHEKRQLYTDSALVRHSANSALVITSANPSFASDSGLADRLLVVRMERRNETEDTGLSKEVLEKRNAGLTWIADTLSKALADTAPVPKGINKRHPDFAELAVRIGRAIGREAEVVEALKNAEADKSLFNLENDEIGSAVSNLVNDKGVFSGTANELLNALQLADSGTLKFYTAKRLGRHMEAIWPHLAEVFDAECRLGHGGVNHFTIGKRGGFGGFEEGISAKVYIEPSHGTFMENGL